MDSPLLAGEGQGERSTKIPVLVELRYYRTEILDLIQDFLQKVPPNLGLVFRQFALSYVRKLKQDIPISKESRRWWHRLLEQLAWVMTCGEEYYTTESLLKLSLS